jgi:hypothetical protein
MAVKGLALGLRNDQNAQARTLFVAALGRIDAPEAGRAMAIASVYDSSEEVRLTCLDQLQTKKRPEVISYYVGKLRDKNNEIVNQAAIALGRMKDPSAIGPLIDALVTSHKFKIQQTGGPNSTSGSFGIGPGGRPGGAGLSAGTKPTSITRNLQNQAVLDALVAITGCNFNFDKQAWWHWYKGQKRKPDSIDARRDSK